MTEFDTEEESYDNDDLDAMEQLVDEKAGEHLDPEKVREAREEEMRKIERRVCAIVDVKECWDETGEPPIRVRWVDARKSNGAHRSRLAAKDYRPMSRVGDVEGFSRRCPLLSW